MACYYLDSSALVKRYVVEEGTSWIHSLCDTADDHTIYVVRTSAVEIVAALFRRARMGSLSPADAQAQAAQFKNDMRHDYEIIEEPVAKAPFRAKPSEKLGSKDAGAKSAETTSIAVVEHFLPRGRRCRVSQPVAAGRGLLRQAPK